MSRPAPALFNYVATLFDGALGVRIFFVISGFLISLLLQNEMMSSASGVSLTNFYIRRFLRLAPAQIAFVFALFLLTKVTSLERELSVPDGADIHKELLVRLMGRRASLVALSRGAILSFVAFCLTRVSQKIALYVAFAFICVSPISRAVEYLDGSRDFSWLTSNSDALMIGCIAAIGLRAWPEAMRLCAVWHPAWCRAGAVAVMAVQ